MIMRVFLTQKARKPTPRYDGAADAPCNRRRPGPRCLRDETTIFKITIVAWK